MRLRGIDAPDDDRPMKRAFVTCEHCGKDFQSPIQVPEGSDVQMSGNTGQCPHCRKMTSIDNLKWKEEDK